MSARFSRGYWLQRFRGAHVVRAAAVVGVASLLAKLAVMLRDLTIAGRYGTTAPADAFLFAAVVANYLVTMLGASVKSALIPVYLHTRAKEGDESASQLVRTVGWWSTLVLTLFLLVSGAALGPLLSVLGGRFQPDQLRLVRELFWLLAPMVALSGLVYSWSAVLNARERFLADSLSFVLPPAVAVTAFVLASRAIGIQAIAVGMSIGTAAQAAVQWALVRRSGVSASTSLSRQHEEFRGFVRQYWPNVGGSLLLGTTVVVDQFFAAHLGEGSVATLSYGNKIVAVITGLGMSTLATAILPYASKLATSGSYEQLRATTKRYARMIGALALIGTAVLVLASQPITRIVYQRGAFAASDVPKVALVQICYALQIPGYALGVLFARMIGALRRAELLLIGNVISMALNVILDVVFMRLWGLPGIALSTAVVYSISCLYLWVALHQTMRKLIRTPRTAAADVALAAS